MRAPAPARAALTFRGCGGLFLLRPGPAVRALRSRALAWASPPPPPALCRDWAGPPGVGAAGVNGTGGSFPAYGRPLGALRAGLRAAEVGRGAAAGEGPGERGRGMRRRARAPLSSGTAEPAVLPPWRPRASRQAEVTARAAQAGLQGGRGAPGSPSSCGRLHIPATRRGPPRVPVRMLAWGTAVGHGLGAQRRQRGPLFMLCAGI